MTSGPLLGVWRLEPGGAWTELAPSSDPSLSGVAELLASIVRNEVEGPCEVVIEREAGPVVELRSSGRGVLAFARPGSMHPLVVKTALQRLEIRSGQAVASVVATPLPSRRVSSFRAIRLDDGDAPPSMHLPSSRSMATVRTDFRGSPHVTDQLTPPAWEVEIETDLPEDFEAPARLSASCTWEAVASWISQAVQTTSEFVGRTVASNYWREVLRRHELLAEVLQVSISGQVQVLTPHAPLDPVRLAALEQAALHWLERVGRVVPDLQNQVVSRMTPAPWRSGTDVKEYPA